MTWSEISFSLRNLPVRAFDSRAQGFSPPLARQRSSCPPPSPNLVRTHLIENHQALRDSAPCLSRAATLPKATKLELGRGAHLKTPSSANYTAAASQPTGRIAKAASWLHLSRVSPALLPPERPSHTHTPKPGFGGRGHEMTYPGTAHGSRRYFQHAHFIPIVGVGKRGACESVHGDLPRQHPFGTTSRFTGPVPADSRQ